MCCSHSQKQDNDVTKGIVASLDFDAKYATASLGFTSGPWNTNHWLIHMFPTQAPYFWPSNRWEPENTDYGESLTVLIHFFHKIC